MKKDRSLHGDMQKEMYLVVVLCMSTFSRWLSLIFRKMNLLLGKFKATFNTVYICTVKMRTYVHWMRMSVRMTIQMKATGLHYPAKNICMLLTFVSVDELLTHCHHLM